MSEHLKFKFRRTFYRSFVLAVAWACIPACGNEAPQHGAGSGNGTPPEANSDLMVPCPVGSGDSCEVGRVVDGDTLEVEIFGLEVKVRLAEIDAPERRQEYGREATELLESIVESGDFQVIDLGPDKYGRKVAHLHGERGCVNQMLVASGAAWHYVDYSNSVVLADLQESAKSARLGLWGGDEVVAPWEFRKEGSGSIRKANSSRQLSEPVYWTGSGRKYHKEGCRYLSRAKEVNKGVSPPDALTPCSVCLGRGS